MRVGDGAPTPLSDLRVVEVSDRIAGSYCGKLLVDAGADVVKVEPKAVTRCDASPPRVTPRRAGADSPLFSYLNAGKRSVTTASETLLARADVVVVTASRAAAIARGIDPQRLLDAAPHCIVVTDLRLRLDGSVGRAPGHRVHPAGVVRVDGLPRRSGRPADLDRRRAWGVHGRRVRRLRRHGPAQEGPQRRARRAPRPVDARGDHVDAERRVAALRSCSRCRRSSGPSRCRRSSRPRTATSASAWSPASSGSTSPPWWIARN